MKPFTKNYMLFALLWAGAFLIACQWLSSAASTSTPVSEVTQPGSVVTLAAEQDTPVAGVTTPETSEADPLDNLLAMRSVKINLTAQEPDGTRRVIALEIDEKSCMHLKYELPGFGSEDLPEGLDPSSLLNNYELYVVDGKVYRPSEQNPEWMTAPLDDDYLQRIYRQFHGADSPGLWLKVLPEGSLRAAGQEMKGGFTVDKYMVNGTIDGQIITGTLWFEPQADALIQAELHIPAALISDPEKAGSGELTITLTAEKADVPSVTLPEPP